MTSFDKYMALIRENIEYKASCAMLSCAHTHGLFQMPCSSQTTDRASQTAVTAEAMATWDILPQIPSGLGPDVILESFGPEPEEVLSPLLWVRSSQMTCFVTSRP